MLKTPDVDLGQQRYRQEHAKCPQLEASSIGFCLLLHRSLELLDVLWRQLRAIDLDRQFVELRG